MLWVYFQEDEIGIDENHEIGIDGRGMEIVSIENIPNSQISISNSLNQLGKTLNTLKNLKLTENTS